MERFLREARIVAALAHPGIVAMHGAGQTPGGGLFLVMDLVRGPDLDRLRRERAITVQEAVQWVMEAARIVGFAHDRGVIHCDLKPSNLLLDGVSIRITDFGLAVRQSDVLTDAALLAGTPAFMAPEQVDPCWGAISPKTDVWGLGAVLYFLLFGRPPHAAADVPSTLASVVSKTPVRFPEDPGGRISQAALSIVRRCLAKRSDDRITSAREVAETLAAVVATC